MTWTPITPGGSAWQPVGFFSGNTAFQPNAFQPNAFQIVNNTKASWGPVLDADAPGWVPITP